MTMVSSSENGHSLAEQLPKLQEILSAGQAAYIKPNGTSMLPMLRQGIDAVVLGAVPEKLRKYDLPLYRRDNGMFVMHRIVKVGKTYTCVGDNQFQLEKELRPDQMIAVVIGFYRGERYYPVSAPSYQIYCRFWHYTRFFRRVWRAVKRRIKRFLK